MAYNQVNNQRMQYFCSERYFSVFNYVEPNCPRTKVKYSNILIPEF